MRHLFDAREDWLAGNIAAKDESELTGFLEFGIIHQTAEANDAGWVTVGTNTVITTWVAAVVSLSLNEGAYMAEIVRAGILSVNEGQVDAAQALGMSRVRTMRGSSCRKPSG